MAWIKAIFEKDLTYKLSFKELWTVLMIVVSYVRV